MKIAIIGAGFSGLALAWHLLDKGDVSVFIFDKEGVGKGASGIASGLLHPYVGEQVRRSWRATEALEATRNLLSVAQQYSEEKVADFSGVVRLMQDEEQVETFLKHEKVFQDIERISEEQFLIKSGITVFTLPYLEALFRACEEKGAVLSLQNLTSLNELTGFDAIIVAAGAGITDFEEFQHWNLEFIKGQSLCCFWPEELPPLSHSIVGKGHLAKGQTPDVFSVGATYERVFFDGASDLDAAVEDLQPKARVLCPELSILNIKEAKAGIRVASKGHYLPQIGKIEGNIWVMTGLGSRGLLYHAFFAEILARALLSQDESVIPPEVQQLLSSNLLSKNKSLAYNKGRAVTKN